MVAEGVAKKTVKPKASRAKKNDTTNQIMDIILEEEFKNMKIEEKS